MRKLTCKFIHVFTVQIDDKFVRVLKDDGEIISGKEISGKWKEKSGYFRLDILIYKERISCILHSGRNKENSINPFIYSAEEDFEQIKRLSSELEKA